MNEPEDKDGQYKATDVQFALFKNIQLMIFSPVSNQFPVTFIAKVAPNWFSIFNALDANRFEALSHSQP